MEATLRQKRKRQDDPERNALFAGAFIRVLELHIIRTASGRFAIAMLARMRVA